MLLESPPHALALWSGLHILLLLVLAALVIRIRRRERIGLGDGGNPALARAIRAFGNAVEYAAPALIGMGVLVMVGAGALLIHLCGALMLTGRVLHAFGLTRTGGASRARLGGMLLTLGAWLVIALSLLVFAFSSPVIV